MDIHAEIKKAVHLHQSGHLREADARYLEILARYPDHPDLLHFRGVIATQMGEAERGIALIREAIRISPHNPVYHNNLGAALRSTGNTDAAMACYRSALKLNPSHAEAWYNLGNLHQLRGDHEDAVICYGKSVEIQRDYPDAWNNLAAAYCAMDQPEKAVDCCKKAIAVNPEFIAAYHNLGDAFRRMGRMDEAAAAFESALELKPDNAETCTHLADLYMETGRLESAGNLYRKAMEIDPGYTPAYGGMGIAMRSRGRLPEALEYFQTAVDISPQDYRGYQNLGNVYLDLNAAEQALVAYQTANRLQPNHAGLLISMGMALRDLGQTEAESACYRKALEIDPENEKACSHLVDYHMQTCDWHALASLDRKLDQMTRAALTEGRRPEEMPFLSLSRHGDAALHHRIAQAWSREIEAGLTEFPKFHPDPAAAERVRRRNSRITVGYLSNNFKNHPTAHLTCGIFPLHDRAHFRVFTYSYGEDDGSQYRKAIMRHSDRFVDLRRMDHLLAARRIYDDGVDILVDMVGYMRGGRMEIPALRPAPLQVRWLGMAGTTGARFFDYLITHSTVTPPDQVPHYSESFAYLPDCYQVNDYRQTRDETPMTRASAGLPADAVVFCSFCTHYKIDASVFDSWMTLLRHVPGSVLWLLKGKGSLVPNLKKAAVARDVNPDRLIFAEKVSKDLHLRRLRLADLSLDTWKVNGAATTSDALWAGVPVVTLKGSHFASRMSANILMALGVPDLIAGGRESYERIALRLAGQPEERRRIKEIIEANRHSKALFDTHRFVCHLEGLYRKMWERYLNGEKPSLLE